MNESATIKISAGDNSYFLINGIPHQRGDYLFQPDRYDLSNATVLSVVNKHTREFVDDCKLRPIHEYINSANIPYASFAQLMLDVAPIAFYATGGLNYSTSEQNTGRTWIDGKPIYQKTYNITGAPFTDNIGVDTIVSAFCYADTVEFGKSPIFSTAFIDGGGSTVQPPVENIGGVLSVDYSFVSTNMTVNSGTLTVQYTKI